MQKRTIQMQKGKRNVVGLRGELGKHKLTVELRPDTVVGKHLNGVQIEVACRFRSRMWKFCMRK
jgi:hypothetical protein